MTMIFLLKREPGTISIRIESHVWLKVISAVELESRLPDGGTASRLEKYEVMAESRNLVRAQTLERVSKADELRHNAEIQ